MPARLAQLVPFTGVVFAVLALVGMAAGAAVLAGGVAVYLGLDYASNAAPHQLAPAAHVDLWIV